MKRFFPINILLILLVLNSCFITNIQVLNVPASLHKLRNRSRSSSSEVVSLKKVYKLKNGMIIDKYREEYGYWYSIRRGDSLSMIAKRSGSSVTMLARINRIRNKSMLTYKAYLFIPLSEGYLKREADLIMVSIKKGDLMWPLIGRITSGFGLRQWGWRKKFHKGIDIAAPVGTKIFSSRDGEVKFSGRQKKYGYVIIIVHDNDFETRYAHLKKVLVQTGDKVEQGQVIGLVGKTGRATGYHLHFEIRIKDYPVNPMDYLPEDVDDLAGIYGIKNTKVLP
ncbi:MAG: LysM peptidoglycan-binding domain-containing M23 family metallopeptidase [Spirochaetes bacterium]|nr:LysM peptidoglycan-binding domain-containing M23 family metallopeptidase [Spirochaetota bacterium]